MDLINTELKNCIYPIRNLLNIFKILQMHVFFTADERPLLILQSHNKMINTSRIYVE